jgi:hypothetical protein
MDKRTNIQCSLYYTQCQQSYQCQSDKYRQASEIRPEVKKKVSSRKRAASQSEIDKARLNIDSAQCEKESTVAISCCLLYSAAIYLKKIQFLQQIMARSYLELKRVCKGTSYPICWAMSDHFIIPMERVNRS